MGFAINTVKLCGSLVFNLGKCGNEPARYLTWGWGEVCYRSLRGFARTFRAIGAHPAYACVYLYAHVHTYQVSSHKLEFQAFEFYLKFSTLMVAFS